MQHTIHSPESLGMVRAQLLEFFEKQSYTLTSLDPNKLNLERRSTPRAAALVLLFSAGEGTRIELDWQLSEGKGTDSTEAQSIERELQGLLAAVQGEINEDEISSASLNIPSAIDAQTFNTILRADFVYRSSARWFFWIAGLSLLNSIVFRLDGQVNFLFGLGITQLVDGINRAILEEGLLENTRLISGFSMVLVLLLSGLFVFFGLLTRKKMKWAFFVGTILYVLDGLILVLLQDYLNAAFHGYILFSLIRGWKAIQDLHALEGSENFEPPPPPSGSG
ncbi:MAG: hypothetical protein RBT34_01440 [Anaerolineaceae bacterium]|jgi:hypothetical protein|nr:hypothetical protein [Anaerolineaceae bacterium]